MFLLETLDFYFDFAEKTFDFVAVLFEKFDFFINVVLSWKNRLASSLCSARKKFELFPVLAEKINSFFFVRSGKCLAWGNTSENQAKLPEEV